MMLKKIYRDWKCQIGRHLSRIGEVGRKWSKRPELCTKSCRAVLRRRKKWTCQGKWKFWWYILINFLCTNIWIAMFSQFTICMWSAPYQERVLQCPAWREFSKLLKNLAMSLTVTITNDRMSRQSIQTRSL